MLHLTIYLSGLLLHLYILTKLLLHATTYLFPPSCLSQYLSTPNPSPSPDAKSNPTPDKSSWALITGSTAGIGYGFAQELLSQGFNVILHGKTSPELASARSQLQHSFPHRRIRLFQFDAADLHRGLDLELEAALEPVLRGISLRVLVNNVGGQAGQTRRTYLPLGEFEPEEVGRVVAVNAVFMTMVTRVVLGRFLSSSTSSTSTGAGAQPTSNEKTPNPKPTSKDLPPSLILNISSLSSRGLPYLSIYSASKAYVESFTRSLHAEMHAENANVTVLGIICGNVQSQGHRLATGWFVPSSREMARAALRCVGPPPVAWMDGSGLESGSASGSGSGLGRRWGLGRLGQGLGLALGGQPALVTPYWPHALQAWGFGILHEKAREWISIWALRGLKDKTDREGEGRRKQSQEGEMDEVR